MKTIRMWFLAILVLGGAIAPRPGRAETVVNSKHNLSVTGPGSIRATSESEVCIFCHAPHGGTREAPLWNRYESGALYTPYASTTTKAVIDRPSGSSKLCLSCHDGTVALGMVRSRASTITFGGGVYNMPPGRSNVGTDLSDDHPISFTYDDVLASRNPELVDPASLVSKVKLDSAGRLQCTTCHDPHDDQYGDFLVRDNGSSALCTTCHRPDDWTSSSHRNSTAEWNGNGATPWPHTTATTVAGNACENCHTPHAAGTKPRLLNLAGDEQNCYACHNGNVASRDIEAEFSKPSTHPVGDAPTVHDPTEDPVRAPRHVTCVDCHNPHASKPGTAEAPDIAGALTGVKGINAAGDAVDPVTHEYEVCFRCHGDSLNRGAARVARVTAQTNTRQEFQPSNPSFHPVETSRNNPDVPSLIGPTYTPSSVINCTDCHNNDSGAGAGGAGARGPHGSLYTPLLERRLELADGFDDTGDVYAMCYKCHSRTSVQSDISFKHEAHLSKQISCMSCHDPHASASNPALINFNAEYVTPFNGKIEYVRTGRFSGNCTLTCHGTVHDAQSYGE